MTQPSIDCIPATANLFWKLDTALMLASEKVSTIWADNLPNGCLPLLGEFSLEGWADLTAFMLWHYAQLSDRALTSAELGYQSTYDARLDRYSKMYEHIESGILAGIELRMKELAEIEGRGNFSVLRDHAHEGLDFYRDQKTAE